MAQSGKHTVYIDIDDEITSIIEKVKSAPDKIVALVLPKRATVLQSIVNMKLLKKSAATAKKSIVLITSEAGLMPLAGVVGLHVAKTLQSKPVIPPPPERNETNEAEIDESSPEDEEPEIDKSKAVGELAGAKAVDGDDEPETIELDNETSAAPVSAGKNLLKKARFKVPNFDKFRLRFFLIILGIVLFITGWIFAGVVLPKAVITITTDTTTVTSTVPFTASTEIQDLDVDQAQVPAVSKEVKKTDTEKTTASGKLDKGVKASGSVVFYNCSVDDKLSDTNRTIPAGSTLTSNGQSFVTSAAVTVLPSSYTGSNCQKNKPSGSVGITATKTGTESNLAANSTFTVSSLSTASATNGSALSGGTPSVIAQVVSQDDIDKAVSAMKGRLDQEAFNELDQQLQSEDMFGLTETRVTSEPVIKSTPALNAEASGEVTVTAETTYSVLGVKRDYLSQLIKKDAGKQIDLSKQSITDDGLDAAAIRLVTRDSAAKAQMTVQALVTAGPEIDQKAIKEQIRGKKRGEVERIIGGLPGVKGVTVQYKPFWVYSTPKAVKKINIVIEKPAVAQPADEASGDE